MFPGGREVLLHYGIMIWRIEFYFHTTCIKTMIFLLLTLILRMLQFAVTAMLLFAHWLFETKHYVVSHVTLTSSDQTFMCVSVNQWIVSYTAYGVVWVAVSLTNNNMPSLHSYEKPTIHTTIPPGLILNQRVSACWRFEYNPCLNCVLPAFCVLRHDTSAASHWSKFVERACA